MTFVNHFKSFLERPLVSLNESVYNMTKTDEYWDRNKKQNKTKIPKNKVHDIRTGTRGEAREGLSS